MAWGLTTAWQGRLGITHACLLLAALEASPALARNSGSPAPVIQLGSWTAFCDNSGGCGVANVSTRRATHAESESPWVCLWLGASDTHEASLSLLLENGLGQRESAPRQEVRMVVVQPVQGTSEKSAGAAVTATKGTGIRYWIDKEGVRELLGNLHNADAALVRETRDGPVLGRISLDGFRQAVRFATMHQSAARKTPQIAPEPFVLIDHDKAPRSLELHRQHCGGERRRDLSVSIYRLKAGQELWTTSCRQSGYNTKSLAMMADKRGNVVPLVLKSVIDHDGVGPDLSNLAVHPERGLIEDYRKTRGAGDCGIRRRWAWTGQRFVLASEEFMPECFGASHSQWLRMHSTAQKSAAQPTRLPC